ncbi:hypothetical protein DMA15_35725 [Streptomyces sp. WAC 01529]|uniref:hypothetical protein n=1 Tax=Streptomyces sp. WAC 01529 TaxID=2203205 RepID=UPI000F6D8B54|nr:hypothetical protein [Streptomyces sp. WAC 01529]AZM57250.1 hypothetical protein DMA15_35725 [Streptomyces sp. WAC 01529]
MRVTLGRTLRDRLPDLAVAALAGPLAVSGIAKAVLRAEEAEELDWPVTSGPLAAPRGAKIVGAAELAAAAVILVAPGRLAALVPLGGYAALTLAAHRLKGTKCACFGAARLTAVGRTHVAANAAASLVAAAALAGSPQRAGRTRAGTAALSAAVTYGTVRALDRRAERNSTAQAAACEERVSSVRLYVSDDCPACRSLKHLLRFMEPARRSTVTTTVVKGEDELPPNLADLGVPCAQGLDARGEPVCGPVSGIGGVKALIDSVTLSAPAVHRAG